MQAFIHQDFLLNNDTARELFHNVAAKLPLIDYHNHLNPEHLAQNKRFSNIGELWVSGDPYKHRAMRINGIAEDGITGQVSDKEKYLNWVRTVPKTLGNPLFHWTCMELSRIFGVDEILSEKNAEDIWNHCNAQLQNDNFGATDILRKWNAEIVCTSDDLNDDLRPHRTATGLKPGLQVLPSLRGDSVIAFDNSNFQSWLEILGSLTGKHIFTLDDYKEAIIMRLHEFSSAGCRLADHSLDAGFVYSSISDSQAAAMFSLFLGEGNLSEKEFVEIKSYVLTFLGKEYAKRNWVLQLHLGAQRYTSSRLRKLAGPAGGYAGIGKTCDIDSLCRYIDSMEKDGLLPRTILYTLNPSDNAAFATLTGSYAEDGHAGKIQFGPAWWYNDHYEGIRQQLISLSSYGLMSHFVGMTTDSRSLLSFSRHEYFRRIVCNLIGEWVENGFFPDDMELLSSLVADISYYNSKKMMG